VRAYSAPPDPLAALDGPTSKREGRCYAMEKSEEMCGKEREEMGKKGEEMGKEGEGREEREDATQPP